MTTFSRSLSLSFALVAVSLSGCEAESASSGDVDEANAALVAEHIQIVETRIAACNSQDWDTWESLHTPDAVRTAPELAGPLEGASEMRAGIEELVETFPDYELTLVDAFGEGDQLMARIHAKGTMLGPIEIDGVEIPPTGKTFEQDWVGVITFDGDKIATIDEFHDNYTLLIQLGLAQ